MTNEVMPKAGTVRVRAAVVYDSRLKSWAVGGGSNEDDDELVDDARMNCPGEGRLIAFIEADVSIPAVPTVQGQVQRTEEA